MTEESPDVPEPPIHHLRWGIKSSFLGYVSRMPDGRAYLGNGAAVNEHNELLFPLTSAEDGTFTFGGTVTFSGHFGMLFVQVAEPRIAVRDGEAEMTVADPESDDGGRLRLVTFGLTGPAPEGDLEHWTAADVRLTEEGVPVFGDVYQAGEQFAPLTITVPLRQGGS